MAYAGYVTLKPDASHVRLEELSRQLESLNCSVHIDEGFSKLEFELMDEESLWLTTGQLTLLFMTFNDVITKQRSVYSRAESSVLQA